jgi:hypothetical protein
MTPVARRITNTQKDGLIFRSRFIKSLFPPRIPVNRIRSMMKEIGAFFFG